MRPFLVRTRTQPSPDNPTGDMVIYVAMQDSKAAALEAVKEAVPAGWRVEDVICEAEPMIVHRKGLKAGDVVRL